jgi:hypothetical protein
MRPRRPTITSDLPLSSSTTSSNVNDYRCMMQKSVCPKCYIAMDYREKENDYICKLCLFTRKEEESEQQHDEEEGFTFESADHYSNKNVKGRVKKEEEEPFTFPASRSRSQEREEQVKKESYTGFESLAEEKGYTLVDTKSWTDDTGSYNSGDMAAGSNTTTGNKRVYYR